MNTSRMFRRFGGLCLAALVTVSSAFAFEGKVDMKVTTDGKETEAVQMSYRIKDDKMRMEFSDVNASSSKKKKKKDEDATGAMIMDFKKKEIIILMASEKMYMVRPIEEPKETKKKKGDEDFKATGRKEKIAGVEAEEYVGKSDGRIIEVWLTKEMGKFITQQGPGGKGGSAWESFAQKESAFPLRSITRKKAGGPEESHMEVIAIDRSKQDAALFAPPSDYQKFEMPAMPGMGDMMKSMIPGR